jgi:hypothetical protein
MRKFVHDLILVLREDLFYHPNMGEQFPKVVIAFRNPAAPIGEVLSVRHL